MMTYQEYSFQFPLPIPKEVLHTFLIIILSVLLNPVNPYPGEPDHPPASVNTINLFMPDVTPTKNDDYLCTSKSVEALGTQFIYKFEPSSDASKAHHMLLFTCDDVEPELLKQGHWDCAHHYSACRNMRIIYAWAKNAPPTMLPKGAGFRIGAESNIKYLVLQVHYAHPMPAGITDQSGFKVHISNQEPQYLAGILIMVNADLVIPKNTEKTHGDMNCMLQSSSPIHPFAYRVHTHQWGAVVSGYYTHYGEKQFHPLAKGNPQWPQAFYPMKEKVTILPQDLVAARCTYNTTGYDKDTRIGMTAGDEMCNLYIMFYTESRNPEDHFIQCMDTQFPELIEALPADSDVPLPRNKTLEEHAIGHAYFSQHPQKPTPPMDDGHKNSHSKKRPGIEFDSSWEPSGGAGVSDSRDDRQLDKRSMYHVVPEWPNPSVKLGQATGVSFDTLGNVVVFHRGQRTWGYNTFDNNNRFRQRDLGPIKVDTVLVIHPTSGKIVHSWGRDKFYMPHGITVATNGDTFLTDVALHQVFKYEPGQSSPSITLGVAFEPGSDTSHFCKPSAVAVLSNGDFFVSDGYCNSRIVKYDKNGARLLEWGRSFNPSVLQNFFSSAPPPRYTFSVPHALALAEEHDLLCVADRENGRIQCFAASSGEFQFLIDLPEFGGQVFSVAYSPVDGGTLFAINGANPRSGPFSQAFVIPLRTKRVSSVFSPNGKGFGQPHDICVNKNASQIYVVEISTPYKVWKFERNAIIPGRTGKGPHSQDSNPDPVSLPITFSKDPKKVPQGNSNSEASSIVKSVLPGEGEDDSFSSSVVIMLFLTIPLLFLIGIGSLMRLRSTRCCNRRKEAKSFSEFFPPSAGFEKLRMDDDSESDNSDTEVEEFTIPNYRKSTLKT